MLAKMGFKKILDESLTMMMWPNTKHILYAEGVGKQTFSYVAGRGSNRNFSQTAIWKYLLKLQMHLQMIHR